MLHFAILINLTPIPQKGEQIMTDRGLYDFSAIEEKWQTKWEDAKVFESKDFFIKSKVLYPRYVPLPFW